MEHTEHFPTLPLAMGESAVAEQGAAGLVSRQRVELFSGYLIASRPILRAYLMTKLRCREAVEDCLQEMALTVWQKFDPEWDEESFRRYSFTCARFKALSWLKKNNPRDLVFIDVEVAEQIGRRLEVLGFEGRESGSERIDAVERCVAGLPDRQRQLLMARYGPKHAETLEDVSAKSSRSMSALYKQLERLRTVLRRCVEKRLSEA